MAKAPRKTPANDAAKSLKETEKRIRAVSKQIEKTGRLRNPKTGAFVKVSGPNIKKVEREILKDVKQSKRTLKAASKFVDTIKGFFKEKKKGGSKSTAKKQSNTTQTTRPSTRKRTTEDTSTPKKSVSQRSKTSVPKPPSKGSKKSSTVTAAPKTKRRKSPTDNSRQRIYEVSELPEAFQTSTANETLEAIEENADAYNELLKPGDVFGGKVGYVNKYGHFVGGYTHQIFPRIEDYIKYMQEYRLLKGLGDDDDKQYQVLDMLKIIRFRAPKKVYSGKVPSFTANSIGWSQMTLSYQSKKEASKKAFKKKMREQDKKRRIEDIRMRGRISALEIENKRLRAERDKGK